LYPYIREADGEDRIVVYKSPEAVELGEVLKKHRGNRSLAAQELGISTTTLWRRMKKYGIESK
jgi:transcriptional regulator of acetoin/glycerol metabolism